jgi:hypothetical protein
MNVFEFRTEQEHKLILARREVHSVRAIWVRHPLNDHVCTMGYMVRMNRIHCGALWYTRERL